jgi:glycosyltransferase involved in cell wall biosynthesis
MPNSVHPLVSVVIPCYNAELYVVQAIRSALAQSYPNIEVIVVDDGSTDRSVDLIRKLPKVQLVQQPHSGACVARNVGLARAKGEFIKFLDADDILVPSALDVQVKAMTKMKDNEIVYGDYAILKDDAIYPVKTPQVRSGHVEELLLNALSTTAPLHRVRNLRALGGFSPALRRGQEWELHVRLALAGYRFNYLATPVFVYRAHDGSDRISNRVRDEAYKSVVQRERFSAVLAQMNGSVAWIARVVLAQQILARFRHFERLGMESEWLAVTREAKKLVVPSSQTPTRLVELLVTLGALPLRTSLKLRRFRWKTLPSTEYSNANLRSLPTQRVCEMVANQLANHPTDSRK